MIKLKEKYLFYNKFLQFEMGRPSNPNLKPIAHRKEESGFQKAKKRKEIALKNQKMAANASKYFKIDPAKDNEVAQGIQITIYFRVILITNKPTLLQ